MFCSKCGAEVNDNAVFCTNCGEQIKAAEAPAEPTSEVPVTHVEQVISTAPVTANSTPILVLGILAAALSEWGVPGIVLGAIGKKKSQVFLEENGSLTGKARAGRILSQIGFIFGIVMTAIWVVFWVVYGIAIGALVEYGISMY